MQTRYTEEDHRYRHPGKYEPVAKRGTMDKTTLIPVLKAHLDKGGIPLEQRCPTCQAVIRFDSPAWTCRICGK